MYIDIVNNQDIEKFKDICDIIESIHQNETLSFEFFSNIYLSTKLNIINGKCFLDICPINTEFIKRIDKNGITWCCNRSKNHPVIINTTYDRNPFNKFNKDVMDSFINHFNKNKEYYGVYV